MSDLLKKPFGKRGKVHQITPESAGWRYVGFSLYHLKAGDKAAEATGDREVILVLVEGKAAIGPHHAPTVRGWSPTPDRHLLHWPSPLGRPGPSPPIA